MKMTKLLGLLAFGSTVAYLFYKNKEKDSSRLDGIEIKINPQKLVDGALAFSNIHPTAKDGIRAIAKTAITKYYDGQ